MKRLDANEIRIRFETVKTIDQVVGAPQLPLFTGDYQDIRQPSKRITNLPVDNYTGIMDSIVNVTTGIHARNAGGGQEYYAALGTFSTIVTDANADPSPCSPMLPQTLQPNVLDLLNKPEQ